MVAHHEPAVTLIVAASRQGAANRLFLGKECSVPLVDCYKPSRQLVFKNRQNVFRFSNTSL